METLILKKKDFDIKKFSFYRKKIFKEKKILIFRKVFSKNLDKLLRAAKLQMNLKPRYIKTNFKNQNSQYYRNLDEDIAEDMNEHMYNNMRHTGEPSDDNQGGNPMECATQ